MRPWTTTYAPQLPSEIVGQERAVAEVRAYLSSYRPGQKPLLLTGPPGSGKTTLVHALARELNLEMLEVNASDVRNKASIISLVGEAAKQRSLFFTGKVILVDEVDGLSGTQDRGGISAIIEIIPKSQHPIIFAANDAATDKLKPLRKECRITSFEPLPLDALTALLTRIARQERIDIPDERITSIARRSGGDARAAITDLQTSMGDLVELDDRERTQSVESGLRVVLKTTDAEVARPAFAQVDTDPEDILMWMEENMPHEYTKIEDRARAMQALADADVMFGRIRRWQYHRFRAYIYDLLTAGIACSKDAKYPGTVACKRSERPLKIWLANQKGAKRKRLAEQLAPHLHTSIRRARAEAPLLRLATKQRAAIISGYDLDPDAAAWLAK